MLNGVGRLVGHAAILGFVLDVCEPWVGLLIRPNTLHVFHVSAQYLRHAPSLRNTPTRSLRQIAIKKFRDVSQSGVAQVILCWLQPFGGLRTRGWRSAINFHVRGYERSNQPRPNGSLMIGAITLGWAAGVASVILRVARRETAQPIERQQILLNFVDYALRAVGRQHAVRQADGKDLIRTDRWIGRPVVHNVIETRVLFIPEKPVETLARNGCHPAIAFLFALVSKPAGEILHDAERIVPERLNLDWLPASRRHHPVADFGVHPG